MTEKKKVVEAKTPSGTTIKAYITIRRGEDKEKEIAFRKYCGRLLAELEAKGVIKDEMP